MTAKEVTHAFYAAFGAGDMERVFSLIAPDVRWRVIAPPSVPYSGEYVGIEAVRVFFGIVSTAERLSSFVADYIIGDETRAAAKGREVGTVVATGRSFEAEWVQLFEVRRGQITEFVEVIDTFALDAAYRA